ncbi:hypothetical protein HKD37_01G002911 [Glycine soja]|nr:hypothetical protein GmHk_01G002963 [Glycine max]
MNALASQCSSGCESGWTLYLEHSFQLNHNASSHTTSQLFKDKQAKKEEAEEEDLSMVSDASSGPPHLHLPDAQDNGSFYSASKAANLGKRSKKRQKVKENQHLPSFLDDTASSPVFDFSMTNVTVTNQQTSTESMLDYSQGFSTTYYEVLHRRGPHCKTTLVFYNNLNQKMEFIATSKQILLLYTGRMVRRERDGNDIKISSISTDGYLCYSTCCSGRY